MILSTNFLKDYLDIDFDTTDKIHELAEVLECEMHPDSDHLHVCKVNVGDEVLQIVCGAPNVRKGLKVIVALPGAKLPGGTISKSMKRGVESNGMLCSIAELGCQPMLLLARILLNICRWMMELSILNLLQTVEIY